jgi:diguanylate cyclase (GGDEF)-like protein
LFGRFYSMKRLLGLMAVLLASALPCWSAAPATLTDLRVIHAQTNAQASQGLPVAFQATVTYYRDYESDLFVQDGDVAIYIYFRPGAKLLQGDRVLVSGKTRDSFRPIVVADSVTVLSHGVLPRPLPASSAQMFRAQLDCRLASVRGVVHSAEMMWGVHKRNIYLQVLIDGGYIDALVNSEDAGALRGLLDAEVEITGVVNAKFDQKMQQWGIALDIQSLGDVKILKRASVGPESLPVTPMEDILGGYQIHDLTQRIRVRGTITYYQPGAAVLLQNGSRSMWVTTVTDIPLHIGDLADASGFPEARDGYLVLAHGEIRDSHVWAPIPPLRVDWQGLGSGENAFDLVSAEGQVVMEAREEAQDEYVVTSKGNLFTAIYRHPNGPDSLHLEPMKQVPIGSSVLVTGISMLYSPDPSSGPATSDLLLRSFNDITVVAPPSWLSVRNLIWIAGLLLFIVLAAVVWGWTLERKVRRQTDEMAARAEAEAALERLRSRLLEDINGPEPLESILEQITEMVSFRMGGVPCWCELKDGAQLGRNVPVESGVPVLKEEIRTRSGAALGMLYALPGPGVELTADYAEALSGGGQLAALAIETRSHYSDLLRRSEFDTLTAVHNRFSLHKLLDERIEEAHKHGGIFGLIYIDLDDFKQVNDIYGHRIGDLYLQGATMRMKHQLRSHDVLARLGGDEFVVVVAVVRDRAEVEEIAVRLGRSLSDPISLEGKVLRGTASFGIALYPEDAVTRDSLLNAADADMYAAKQKKRQVSQMPESQ